MQRIALASIVSLLLAHGAAAAPTWSQISFATTASEAPRILAAADELMSSEVGKEFGGKLLLQVNSVDGANPATHTFVPIYETAAEREAFVQKLQGSEAWGEFLEVMEDSSEPVSTVLYQVVKSWGDRVETDHVWIAHAFSVDDAAAFLKAIEDFMATETGKQFPGQVYLSAVVAAGMSPVSHVISVGYASEAEMFGWARTRAGSKDWQRYLDASRPVSEYLGASIARDLKSWGPATFEKLVAP